MRSFFSKNKKKFHRVVDVDHSPRNQLVRYDADRVRSRASTVAHRSSASRTFDYSDGYGYELKPRLWDRRSSHFILSGYDDDALLKSQNFLEYIRNKYHQSKWVSPKWYSYNRN